MPIRTLLWVTVFFSVFSGAPASAESARVADKAEIAESQYPEVPFEAQPQESQSPEIFFQAQSQEPLISESPAEPFQFPVFRTIGGLGLVLSLMVALYFGARKYFPQYFQKTDSEKKLRMLETLSMGDRRSIALIQVAGTRFLVGNTPHQINLLTTISEPIPSVNEAATSTSPNIEQENKESVDSFRNLFEFEKKRPVQNSASPLPEDIRKKMRLLREALDR